MGPRQHAGVGSECMASKLAIVGGVAAGPPLPLEPPGMKGGAEAMGVAAGPPLPIAPPGAKAVAAVPSAPLGPPSAAAVAVRSWAICCSASGTLDLATVTCCRNDLSLLRKVLATDEEQRRTTRA